MVAAAADAESSAKTVADIQNISVNEISVVISFLIIYINYSLCSAVPPAFFYHGSLIINDLGGQFINWAYISQLHHRTNEYFVSSALLFSQIISHTL